MPEPPETVSLLTFLLLDAPVALLVWGSLVMALAAALRSRWIAVAAALALLGLFLYAVFNTPLYLLPAFSGITNLGLAGRKSCRAGPQRRTSPGIYRHASRPINHGHRGPRSTPARERLDKGGRFLRRHGQRRRKRHRQRP